MSTLSGSDQQEARIERVVNNLIPLGELGLERGKSRTLIDHMQQYHVPGISIAVVDGGSLAWERGFGVRDTSRGGAVDGETLFQAASISKPVSALAALRLVERGTLALDADINQYLRSWKVPPNNGWQPVVTLRHLLCHGGGTTIHGVPGYHRTDPLPTITQILDGQKPANTTPVRVDALPGVQFRYSGGGYCVLQQLLMDVTGQPFAALLRELVLDPLGMRVSTFEQPLPEHDANATSGHFMYSRPIEGGAHVHPEQATAGLWTTAGDLCRFAIGVRAAYLGTPDAILGRELAQQMLAPQVERFIGLGLFLEGDGEHARFGHGGGNVGYLCELTAYREHGLAAAVMTNGEGGWGALMGEVLRAIAAEYNWPGYLPAERVAVPIEAQAAARWAGEYALRPDYHLVIRVVGDGLELVAAGQQPIPLFASSDERCFARAVNLELTAGAGDDGSINTVTLHQNGQALPAERVV